MDKSIYKKLIKIHDKPLVFLFIITLASVLFFLPIFIINNNVNKSTEELGLKENISTVKANSTTKEVVGFYQSYMAQTDEYKTLRYDLLNTIIYAQVNVNADGSLVRTSNYNPAPLIQYAHSQGYGTKVVLMFNSVNAVAGDTILANTAVRDTAITNLLNEVKANGFDGVDIDLERITWGINPINGQSNKDLMTNFVTEVNNKFLADNPNYRLSLDISWDYLNSDKVFDIFTLQNKVDYIMMMGYDWWFLWSGKTMAGPTSPMAIDIPSGSFSSGILDSVRHYEGLMNKSKFLLGVPWYGYEFATVDNSRHATKSSTTVPYIAYENYADTVKNYTINWDSVWQIPWYIRQNSTTGQWYEGFYEDLQSLGVKYDLTKTEDLGGIGIWALTHGTNRPELWQLIQDKFASVPVTPSVSPSPEAINPAYILTKIQPFLTPENRVNPNTPLCKSFGGPCDIYVYKIPNTNPVALVFQASGAVDCDGQRTAICNESTDDMYQYGTSFEQSDGQPLDASTLPFYVLPDHGNYFNYATFNIQGGQLGLVMYQDKMNYGVFGDENANTQKIGEVSYAMASSLGINPDPINGGAPSGVSFIVFTGSGSVVSPIEDHSKAVTMGDSALTNLLAQLGGGSTPVPTSIPTPTLTIIPTPTIIPTSISTPTPTIIATTLGSAVDNTGLVFTTWGAANWFAQNSKYYFGASSAQSGKIGNSKSSYIQTTVTGPGTLKFWWKVSSERYGDYLRFYVDNKQKSSITGSINWQQKIYNIQKGTHTLKWRYIKDYGMAVESDAGWIDKVEYLKLP